MAANPIFLLRASFSRPHLAASAGGNLRRAPAEAYIPPPPGSAAFLREGRETLYAQQSRKKKIMTTTNTTIEGLPAITAQLVKAEQANLPGIESLVQPFKFQSQPHEYKVTPLRECPTPMDLQTCDTPDKVAAYWHLHIATNPYFDPERECLAVILLNTRRRAKGHQLISIGTLDTLLVSPTSVFRLAVMTSAASIVLAHQHPSGDQTPSEADI